MTGTRILSLLLLLSAALCAADPAGKWEMVWATPGGERRGSMTVTIVDGENVKAELNGGREPIPGKFRDGELTLSGKLYSAEAGSDGLFKLQGKLNGDELKGTASWDEHQMTFTATRAK